MFSHPQDSSFAMLELLDLTVVQRTHGGGAGGKTWVMPQGSRCELGHCLIKKKHIKYEYFISSEIIHQQMKCRAPVCAPGFRGCLQRAAGEGRGGPHCTPETGWRRTNGKWDFFGSCRKARGEICFGMAGKPCFFPLLKL